MSILIIHNYYQQFGGEDIVFEAEKTLLKSKGHNVFTFVEDNARLNGFNILKAAVNTIWSQESIQRIQKLIELTKPDVAHFHNTFIRISPSAYYACKKAGIPVVQSLHNFRTICPGALLMRGNMLCEDCIGKFFPWPGAVHACWRKSKPQSAVVVSMLAFHRLLKTWTNQVNKYIALTDFSRNKFIQGGLPAEKIVVKPNFVDSDQLRANDYKLHAPKYSAPFYGQYALFVGRLSPEKGIQTLCHAWQAMGGASEISLKIVGDGPLLTEVKSLAEQKHLKIEVLGRQTRVEVFRLMQGACFLVFPSEWYEGLPMTIIESYASGLPVVASRLGAMAEIVEDGYTGLHFEPGNARDLAEKINWALKHPDEMARMGRNARNEYEAKYTPERNYAMLMDIYNQVISRH
ncbi:MAG: glycosyltransferase family 4 protein [Desulfamplus sp.]|nr:glycosyltransferase family 4 protein [Desulfamplus sp.]